MTLSKNLASLFVLLLLSSGVVFAEDWPQFRGPDGQGHSSATDLPLNWSESENVAWKTPIPGKAWSSPVIEGNEIWMTTSFDVKASKEDAEKRLEVNTGSQPLVLSSEVIFHAVCVDRTSGEVLKNIKLMSKKDPQWIHQLNSYASPTPILEDGLLYCHFGSYGTACLDTKSGKVLWTNQEIEVMHENGPGATAVLWQDNLIFHSDGSDNQFISALDKKTGALKWQTLRSGKMNENPQFQKCYGTPLVVEVDGKDQLISPAADWVYAYDPQTGGEISKHPYGALGFSIVSRPVTGHGLVYLSTGFMKTNLLAIRFHENEKPEKVWSYDKQVARMSSPILVGDEIYFISDKGGILTCLDALSGEVRFQERLGGNFASSPLYADGKIYFSSQEGVTFVIKSGKEFNKLARNQLDGSIMASPAALDHSLFFRTDKAMYRIEK